MQRFFKKHQTVSLLACELAILMVGIILFNFGLSINRQYNNSITVNATITNIHTSDPIDAGDSYSHTYYGNYSVNGENYTNKLLETFYNGSHDPKHKIGDTIDIKVNSENPNKIATDGGLLLFLGLSIIIFTIAIWVIAIFKSFIKVALIMES